MAYLIKCQKETTNSAYKILNIKSGTENKLLFLI